MHCPYQYFICPIPIMMPICINVSSHQYMLLATVVYKRGMYEGCFSPPTLIVQLLVRALLYWMMLHTAHIPQAAMSQSTLNLTLEDNPSGGSSLGGLFRSTPIDYAALVDQMDVDWSRCGPSSSNIVEQPTPDAHEGGSQSLSTAALLDVFRRFSSAGGFTLTESSIASPAPQPPALLSKPVALYP